ncbi:Lon protease-like protein [Acidovorax sp. 62]|uniref:Lon protease family protein n=1 Tax=Acidovorax sp. 62 TaxID=2035203 RepID=UPI000C6BD946|nr:ATP-binding protein [Acidovorax sp. 62]PIF91101.1 Lon protease-like protein [Acidovorax sp. 62]
MPAHALSAPQLRLTIDPVTLGFASTAELQDLPLPWIGQERAQAAAQFGLQMAQPDYHLFVLGEVGSGRASLMRQAMHTAAALRPVPPDLCYLHNFESPEHPRALRLPAGQGRVLRRAMAELAKALQTDIPRHLTSPDFRAQARSIEQAYEAQEAQAFATLQAFAQARQFQLSRTDEDGGHLVFTLTGANGEPLTESEARALPPEQRARIDEAEQALRNEIVAFAQTLRPLERTRDDALTDLRRRTVRPVVQQALNAVRAAVPEQPEPLPAWLQQVERELLNHLHWFELADLTSSGNPGNTSSSGNSGKDTRSAPGNERSDRDYRDHRDNRANDEEDDNNRNNQDDDAQDALDHLLHLCQVHLAVDHHGQAGAPVIVEDNPQHRTLFGSIESRHDGDTPQADYTGIRAGSLLRAHGGFLLLHLHDLTHEEGLWARLRRFLRCNRLHIDEATSGASAGAPVALQPEAVQVDVKIVLIGTVDEYYALQEADPDTARRFRAKVDFVERFTASPATRLASAIFVAHSCKRRGLPHFGAPAVALLLEQAHREADDQGRQSAQFGHIEALLMEAAALCQARGGTLVEPADVHAAQQARTLRHNYPEEELHESIVEGERLITLTGSAVGQINALTQIDLGDYRFGFPVRITARTFAGQEGLLNIEREVDMSGPIHDKGVLILHSYLTALFSHVAPLALNASIVFEQEYSGIEGDSASCAELYALLSSLSGLPLRQGIAITGALNQHGEVLPVGGINEKIEGWFRACHTAGLDGTQGVLIPARNQRHLMLSRAVLDAVERGLFHVYTMQHVSEGIALLTGEASGMSPAELVQAQADELAGGAATMEDTVMQRAEQTLRAYRRACQVAGGARRGRGGRGR